MSLVDRPEIREALFLGSPDLEQSLDAWRQRPDSERGAGIERAVVRYFSRMTGRPTPFGLFAGVSIGRIGAETRFVLGPRSTYRRHTRLDMDLLGAIAAKAAADSAIRERLTYRPNPGLHSLAGRMRYAETKLVGGGARTYSLVAVEESRHLSTALEHARPGATLNALGRSLLETIPDVSPKEASEFLDELVDCQVLVSDLAPGVTGPEPIHHLLEALGPLPEAGPTVATLASVRDELDDFDAHGLGIVPSRYRSLEDRLKGLDVGMAASHLFQVDLHKTSDALMLGSAVLEEILGGVELLQRLTQAKGRDTQTKFREDFVARFEKREVPLIEALDEDVGVGYAKGAGARFEVSPLLAQLPFPAGGANGRSDARSDARYGFLWNKLQQEPGFSDVEVVLTEKDLATLADPTPGRPELPDAVSVSGWFVASSERAFREGDYLIVLDGVVGPSGARMLGRFCHGDPEFESQVAQHLQAEEKLRPDVAFAEIVHLPQDRMGNVICRPVMRDYEIPILCRSGVDLDHQIPIEDLLVSVVNDRIVLRSQRLQKEVVPRLTSAHNYVWDSLAIYRFLGELQNEGRSLGAGWSWGPLEACRFLPRVRVGRIVLTPARWKLSRPELAPLTKAAGADLVREARKLRAARALPRWVVLKEGDNSLLLDLENILCLETFVDMARKRQDMLVTEPLGHSDDLCLEGPEGRFVHHFVIPLVRRSPVPSPNAFRRPLGERPFTRTFLPGSEWLYLKLFAGVALHDELLRDLIGPLVLDSMRAGTTDGWFFLRYDEKGDHLRLRLHGRPEALAGGLLPRFHSALASHAGGKIWRLQLDTYEREVERYGGELGVLQAEQLFMADSEAVLTILGLLSGGEGQEQRWLAALASMDMMLQDFGFELPARLELARDHREALGRRFGLGKAFHVAAGSKYRQFRQRIERALRHETVESEIRPDCLRALRRRSALVAPIVEEIRNLERTGTLTVPVQSLVGSFLHMNVNRLMRSSRVEHELVFYDFLVRWYESLVARARRVPAIEATPRRAFFVDPVRPDGPIS